MSYQNELQTGYYQNNFGMQPQNQFYGSQQLQPVTLRKHPQLKGVLLPYRGIENIPFPMIHAVSVHNSQSLGVPYDMSLLGVIGSIMLACQSVADVKTSDGRIIPESLLILFATASGTGKSAILNKIKDELESNEDVLLTQKLGVDFDSEANDRPFIIHDDVSITSLLEIINKVKTGALIADEAISLFQKWDSDAMAMLNKLSDGGGARKGRGSQNAKNVKIEKDARLSGVFALTFKALIEFINSTKGKMWVNNGAFNRFLICYPQDGFSPPNRQIAQNPPFYVEQFKERERALLFKAFVPGYEREVESFDPQAELEMDKIEAYFYQAAKPGGYFEGVQEYAAKLPDLIRRVAGGFHSFLKLPGDISVCTVEAVSQVILHYADYHVALFTKYPDSVVNAYEIRFECISRLRAHPDAARPENRYIYLESLYEHSFFPSGMSTRARKEAMKVLHQWQELSVRWEVKKTGKRSKPKRGKQYIDLFPGLPPNLPKWLELGEAVFDY